MVDEAEYEQLKQQKVRLEIELEASVRNQESKVKVLKNSADKALTEASKLRLELSETSKTALLLRART